MNHKVRKSIIRGFVGLLAFLLFILVSFVAAVTFIRPKPSVPDTTDWHTGMVFFSVGDSWESAAVRSISGLLNVAITDSTPSHCGIVIRDSCCVKLVHASTAAKRIVAETPEDYLKNNGSNCLYVMNVSRMPDSIAIRNTIDSLVTNRIPFDFDFNHNDSKSLYCTEMVLTVFEQNSDMRFSPLRKQSYIYPENILKIITERQ